MTAVVCKFPNWQMFFALCTPLVRKTQYTERDMINGNELANTIGSCKRMNGQKQLGVARERAVKRSSKRQSRHNHHRKGVGVKTTSILLNTITKPNPNPNPNPNLTLTLTTNQKLNFCHVDCYPRKLYFVILENFILLSSKKKK